MLRESLHNFGGNWTPKFLQENAPEWAKHLLDDLHTGKVEWVEETLYGAKLSGFKLKATGKWHIYRKLVASNGNICEEMFENGKCHGLFRNLNAIGSVLTSFYKHDKPVGKRINYTADHQV